MRRALSVVSLSLVLYAGMIFLSTLLMCNTVQANDLAGGRSGDAAATARVAADLRY